MTLLNVVLATGGVAVEKLIRDFKQRERKRQRRPQTRENPHSQKFRTMSGVTYGATFNAVIGSRLFRKQVTLVPLPTSKL